MERSCYLHTSLGTSSPCLPGHAANTWPNSVLNLPTSLSSPFPTQTLDNQNLWKFACISYATFKMGLLYTVCNVVLLRSHSYSAPGSVSLYLLQKRLTPMQSMFTFSSLTPSTISLKNLTLENKDNSNLSYRW